MEKEKSFSVYFGGGSLSYATLIKNALLAESLATLSKHRYCPVLPQNLNGGLKDSEGGQSHALLRLLECDLVLLDCSAENLAAKTQMEFMLTKFADIPTLALYTEGDATKNDPLANSEPCISHHPRMHTERIDIEAVYESAFMAFPITSQLDAHIEQRSSQIAQTVTGVVAQAIIDGLEMLLKKPPKLKAKNAASIYAWLSRSGCLGSDENSAAALQRSLRHKIENGLLQQAKA